MTEVSVTARRTLLQSILCPPTVFLKRDKLFGRKGFNKASIIDTDGDEGLSCSLCHWSQVEERDASSSSHLTKAVRTIIGIEKDEDLVFCPFCSREVANLLGVKAEIDRLEERLMDMIEGLHTLLSKKKDFVPPQVEEVESDSEAETGGGGPWIKVDKVYSVAEAELEQEESTDDDDDDDGSATKVDDDISVKVEETRSDDDSALDFEESSFSFPSPPKKRPKGLTRAKRDPEFENRRHRCGLCPLRFSNKPMLDKHLITHLPMDQKRPYTVPCPHCPRLFRDDFNLRIHLNSKTHSHLALSENKNKPYRCAPCEKSYSFKQSLDLHMKSVEHRNKFRSQRKRASAPAPGHAKKTPPLQKEPLKARSVASNFHELKKILSNPTPGMEIELTSGLFDGQLEIDALPERVRIFGAGPGTTIVKATKSTTSPFIWKITAGNNCTFEKMTFEKEGSRSSRGPEGLQITGGEGVKIQDVDFIGCNLELIDCKRAEISDVMVEGTICGMILDATTENTVVKNAFLKNLTEGICVAGDNNRISGVECTDCATGVLFNKWACKNTLDDLTYRFFDNGINNQKSQTAVRMLWSGGNEVTNVKCLGYNIRNNADAKALWIQSARKKDEAEAASENVVKGLAGGPVWVGGERNVVEDLTQCPLLVATGTGHRFINCIVEDANVRSDMECTNCNFNLKPESSS